MYLQVHNKATKGAAEGNNVPDHEGLSFTPNQQQRAIQIPIYGLPTPRARTAGRLALVRTAGRPRVQGLAEAHEGETLLFAQHQQRPKTS
jgi:hypothetical protein